MGFREGKQPTGPRPRLPLSPDNPLPVVPPVPITTTATMHFAENGLSMVQVDGPLTRNNRDLLRLLAAGPTLHEFARADEIVGTLGPTLEAAAKIGLAALEAYKAEGRAGLLQWVRDLRGRGLAIAHGEGATEKVSGISEAETNRGPA